MFRLLALLFLFCPTPSAHAGTMYIATKEFPWEWGEVPWDYDGGMDRIRAWLEAKPTPKLREPTRPLKKETIRYHELEKTVAVKFAVVGPPRSVNGHNAQFYAWIEWVSESKFAFDLDEKRIERKAGIARIAIEGAGERSLNIREWHWEKDLHEEDLGKIFPWDAAVIARKMIEFHRHRPRQLPEKAGGPGKHSLY